MIREVDIKVYYELDDTDIITSDTKVEKMVYDYLVDYFGWDEGFQGLRVDCYDTLENHTDIKDKRRKLRQFIGV